MIDGIKDTFVRVVVGECCYRVFVAAVFYLVFKKEESGPEVVDRFLKLLFDAPDCIYVRVGGWN